MTLEQLEALATRGLRIEKFKRATWANKLESYFLSRKSLLDKVIYSLIRTKDVGVAKELYFRIQEGEQSFSELAREFSQGSEAQIGGLVGPIELGKISSKLAQMLYISQTGQLWPPTRLGECIAIVRLEQLIPAVLDEAMRQQLLNELFERWVQERLVELTSSGLISLD
ncbi:peptidylprolyl isomerase [Trichocoleus sp. DQ-A3]|uniref:peptidylprolyl isomerase n=1 Tax=Cyanophyceae TaxID=3028117 RepID=UPI001F550BC7|nr:peptidylprolyl isomerase [Coleofasciculus sp. FACHB-125]